MKLCEINKWIDETDVAVKRTEARECWSESHTFKGLCFSDHNCATVCFTEGFTGGKCEGVRHRCLCSKICWKSFTHATFSINKCYYDILI